MSLLFLLLLLHFLLLSLLLVYLLQTLLESLRISDRSHLHCLWISIYISLLTCMFGVIHSRKVQEVCNTPGDPPAAGSV